MYLLLFYHEKIFFLLLHITRYKNSTDIFGGSQQFLEQKAFVTHIIVSKHYRNAIELVSRNFAKFFSFVLSEKKDNCTNVALSFSLRSRELEISVYSLENMPFQLIITTHEIVQSWVWLQ